MNEQGYDSDSVDQVKPMNAVPESTEKPGTVTTEHSQQPSQSQPTLDLDIYRRALPMRTTLRLLKIEVNGAGFIFCLLHQEQTASGKVYDYHVHCFSCHWHVDVIGIVMQVLNLDFWGALEWIAREAGLPMPRRDPEAQKRYEAIRSVSELYLKVYQDSLKDPEPALAYLEKRGIPREVTTGIVGYLPHDYKPCDLETGRAAGLASKSKRVLHAGRLIIPIYRMGQIVGLYGRALDDKRIPKHIYPAKTDPAMPAALWGLDDVRKEKVVFLCESIIDALTLRALGLPAFAAFGTQGLTDARIQLLKGTGIERVIVVFDVDRNGHESGQKGALEAGRKLFEAGFDVSIISFPLAASEDKIDVNSYFLTHSREDFDKLPRVDIIEALARALPVNDGIKRFFQELGTLTSLIANQPEECHESYTSQLHSILKTLRLAAHNISAPTLAYLTKKVSKKATEADKEAAREAKFRPLSYVERLRQGARVIYFDSRCYQYGDGVYRYWRPEEIKQKTIGLIGKDARAHQLSEINEMLGIQAFVLPEKINPPGVLNLKNGLLYTETGEFKLHTADFLSTVQIPITFDENAMCPTFDRFITEKVPEQALRCTVQEITGYLLTPDTRHQVGFLLKGPRRSGKSTYVKIARALLGECNVSAVSLDKIGERFQTVGIAGKLANFSTELSVKAFLDDGPLKAIISGDAIRVEEKHIPGYDLQSYCRIVAATNKLPLCHDVDPAFFRRWICVPMNVTHKQQESDLDLEKRIIENELSGVLLWALAGLARLRRQGHFTHSEASANLLEEWKCGLDPVYLFAKRFFRPNKGDKVLLQTIFRSFNAWCEATNRKSQFTDTNLKDRLTSIGYTFKHTNRGDALLDHWLAAISEETEAA